MRYDEFRDQWQEALRSARLLAHHDRPEETVDATTERRWKVHPLLPFSEPFHVGARIGFRWDPLQSARSYTCEEDLLTEILGRTARRSTTQPRLLRIDFRLHAGLPYGSTLPLPSSDLWTPWLASVEESLRDALTQGKRRKATIAWCGDLQLEGRASRAGAFELQGMYVEAYEMVVLPRVWDDPKRRAREASSSRESHALATRFRAAVDAWNARIGDLATWLRHARGRAVDTRQRRGRRPPGGQNNPETKH